MNFSIKYRYSDILLKKNINFIYYNLICRNHTCYCVNMVSVTSASRYHPCYQSRSWSDSTEFRGIGRGSSDCHQYMTSSERDSTYREGRYCAGHIFILSSNAVQIILSGFFAHQRRGFHPFERFLSYILQTNLFEQLHFLHWAKKGCTTIRRKTLRRIRQLVYKDNWSTTTVCRMRHLVYSFFYLRHLVEKNVNA